MLREVRDFFERFYPSDPIRIVISKLKTFFLIIFVVTITGIFYLRYQNKNELEILKQKHKMVKENVQMYLRNMTYNNEDEVLLSEYRAKLKLYHKKLKDIEDEIDDIKKFWFLE